jgi:hypothetical protein
MAAFPWTAKITSKVVNADTTITFGYQVTDAGSAVITNGSFTMTPADSAARVINVIERDMAQRFYNAYSASDIAVNMSFPLSAPALAEML